MQYGRLVDIGREVVERQVPRSLPARVLRWLLRRVLPHPARFALLLGLGRLFRPLLPHGLKKAVPAARPAGRWPEPRHPRRIVVAGGCVQPALAPDIDSAAARVCDAIGISAVALSIGCCGAVSYHLNAQAEGLDTARIAIDRLVAALDAGAEGIVVSASGCASFVVEYAHHLRGDPAYAGKAARVTAALIDLTTLLTREAAAFDAALARTPARPEAIAFHSPCTLQHGLKSKGQVERLLTVAGFRTTVVADAHLCCGSAGTWSILQPQMSAALKANKLAALEAGQPSRIATANIGCLSHLASGAQRPVEHWIELIAERLGV